MATPTKRFAYYRLIDRISLKNCPFPDQAAQLQRLLNRYPNCTHIGIDKTGPGLGVFDLVRQFYPSAEGIHYSPEQKNSLVLKLKNLITQRRVRFDSDLQELILACMSIKQVWSGSQVTFKADRTVAAGHADIAWALMHALTPAHLTLPGQDAPEQHTESFCEIG